MSALGRYFRTHWRGDQPLLVALLINGVLGYLVLVAATVGTADVMGITQVTRNTFSLLLGSASLVLLVTWGVWASVGIVRCVLKRYLPTTQPIGRRLVGATVLLLMVVVAVITICDVVRLLGPPEGLTPAQMLDDAV